VQQAGGQVKTGLLAPTDWIAVFELASQLPS
jgi:hypothetical protein